MRDLKGAKAAKADLDAAVKELLELKVQFKAETGRTNTVVSMSYTSRVERRMTGT